MIQEVVREFREKTFSSLSVRNYRLYFIGQGISQVGSWMQVVAMGWLVLQLTGSGVALGTLLGIRFLPVLFFGPFGGAVVDRFDKRRLVLAVQSTFTLAALILTALVFWQVISMWMLYLLVFINGCIDVFDRPARQTFVHEMVGPEHLRNAVTLNSTAANVARAVGPLIAGVLIAGIGTALCFFFNALSYVAVLVVLLLLNADELNREKHEPRPLSLGVFTEAFRYVRDIPNIFTVLMAMTVIGTLSYEFQTSLPLLAKVTFGGSASDYAALTAAVGAGAVAGGLYSASRATLAPREFVFSAILFGASVCVAAIMPTLTYTVVALVVVGFFSISLTSVGNTMVQLESASERRGGVMSLWSMAIFGSTVVGAPTIGIIGQYAGARWSLLAGGIAAILAGLYAGRRMLGWSIERFIPESVEVVAEETEASETPKI